MGIFLAAPNAKQTLMTLFADVLEGFGCREQALTVYESALSNAQPKYSQKTNALALKAALLAYSLDRKDQAQVFFQTLLRTDEYRLVSAKHLAIMALDRKDYENAVGLSSQWIELDPRSALAYEVRGSAYVSLNRTQEAMRDLDRSIEINPDSHAVEVKSRLNATWSAAFPEAFFDPKMENKTGDYDSTIRDCIRLMHAMDKDDALKLLGKTIAAQPKRPEAYFLRSLFYYRDQDFNKALTDLKSTHACLNGRRSVLLPRPKELGTSKIDLLAWTTHIQDDDVLYRIGRSYAFLKDTPNALVYCNKAIIANPKNSNAYAVRGLIYKAKGNLKQAQADIILAHSLALQEKREKRENERGSGPRKEDLVEILSEDQIPTISGTK